MLRGRGRVRRAHPSPDGGPARGGRFEGDEAAGREGSHSSGRSLPEDEALLEALRDWRREAAGGKPAYTVANNRTLETIAAARPRDADSLAEIHGVGPAFLKRHGDDVLELVADQAA